MEMFGGRIANFIATVTMRRRAKYFQTDGGRWLNLSREKLTSLLLDEKTQKSKQRDNRLSFSVGSLRVSILSAAQILVISRGCQRSDSLMLAGYS